VSERETPEAVGNLLLKYIKDNIGAAIGLVESLMSSVEQAIAVANADAASKVVIAVRLGKITEDLEILKVVAPKDSLSDAMLEVISALLRALADLNAGRSYEVEKELLGLQLTLGRTVDRLIEGCTRAQAGEARESGQA
jgi:hypothetical protein